MTNLELNQIMLGTITFALLSIPHSPLTTLPLEQVVSTPENTIESTVIIIEFYFKSPAASFPIGKSPTRTGGNFDPATYVEICQFETCLLFDPIDLSGAVATRRESADVCGERGDRCSRVLGALPIVW
jgi:hypothetical protein